VSSPLHYKAMVLIINKMGVSGLAVNLLCLTNSFFLMEIHFRLMIFCSLEKVVIKLRFVKLVVRCQNGNLFEHVYKKLTKESEHRVENARKMVDEIVKENRTVYGITTGFGKFARTVIPKDKLK